MVPAMISPEELADLFGLDYRRVLHDYKESGFATKEGRRWYLPREYVSLLLAWDPACPPTTPIPSS